jgi:tryptophan synthase beta chain
MTAYQAYHDGKMSDIIPTDEELEKGFATIPVIE